MSDILPWQVKRLVVVQVIQVFPGPSYKGIGIIQQDIWLTRNIFHLRRRNKVERQQKYKMLTANVHAKQIDFFLNYVYHNIFKPNVA